MPCRTLVNLAVAFGVVMVARFVPYLSTVMSLVGAFLTITISIIFPAAANFKLHRQEMSRGARLWDIFVMALGVGCAISGTFAALSSLKAKMGM
jgi:solute carrier family 32 (vesicular inhibitory amino acid transporter)